MADREDFERLALPLMRWLRATRNPHTSVIVTSSCAELVSGEMSVVESDERVIECICAEIDPSDRPCLVCECSAPAQDAPSAERCEECEFCNGSGRISVPFSPPMRGSKICVCVDCDGTGKARR